MMRAPLQDHRITIPPSYVEQVRAQFMRIFIDFVDGGEGDDDVRGKMRYASCPAAVLCICRISKYWTAAQRCRK